MPTIINHRESETDAVGNRNFEFRTEREGGWGGRWGGHKEKDKDCHKKEIVQQLFWSKAMPAMDPYLPVSSRRGDRYSHFNSTPPFLIQQGRNSHQWQG